ncbi:MAG: bifunctional precorrin-2 dehydrogenase/sirohydrochlorin ferrochelatase [Clostridiaceae bacterium]|jgi:siroheme synthase-like protein|nr:bifunctional precorrin-2 dehydrogenase/sirohydrochlorin ferrochelatase [Clostridiaceae bacterium]
MAAFINNKIMAYFPFFIDLNGVNGLIAGGGTVAERKVEILLEFGVRLTVVATEASPRLEVLAENGKILLKRRAFESADLNGAFFAIAATDDDGINREVSRRAKAAGVLVNVVDSPDDCGFIFPALIKKEDLIVAVSTSGACPAAAREVKEKIEEFLPTGIGQKIASLKELRGQLKYEDADRRAVILTEAAKGIFK